MIKLFITFSFNMVLLIFISCYCKYILTKILTIILLKTISFKLKIIVILVTFTLITISKIMLKIHKSEKSNVKNQ